jgi:hypothetical protein
MRNATPPFRGSILTRCGDVRALAGNRSAVTERAKGCELGFLQLNSGNATANDLNLTGTPAIFYTGTERNQSSLSVTSSYSRIRMPITRLIVIDTRSFLGRDQRDRPLPCREERGNTAGHRHDGDRSGRDHREERPGNVHDGDPDRGTDGTADACQ